jgi:hypothetical protein
MTYYASSSLSAPFSSLISNATARNTRHRIPPHKSPRSEIRPIDDRNRKLDRYCLISRNPIIRSGPHSFSVALVALATLILFFVFPNKSYYTTPANVMPFIYANTMLVVLNSRFQIVGGRSTPPTSLNFASWPVLSLGDTTTMSGATSTQTQTRTREVISNREMDSSMEMNAVQAHGVRVIVHILLRNKC